MNGESLDLTKVLNVAEELVYDDQLGFAASITKPVQKYIDELGNEHEIVITIKMIKRNKQ